ASTHAAMCCCVMPGSSPCQIALYKASVALFATCISASSAELLIARQPAVTGVAGTSFACGIAAAMPLERKNGTFSSMQHAGAGALLAHHLRDQRVGAFVLLPGAHVAAEADLLQRAAALERGRDVHRLARARQQHAHQALAGPPAHAGVVVQRGAAVEVDGAH